MANLQVLIVDDSVVFRSQIKAALEGVKGVNVAGVASNGKIALEKLSQMPIDLVTMDLEMPVLNGLQTLAEMKRLGIKAKVIVFSSKSQRGADSALEALTHGASDVVPKPSGDTNSLEEALQKVKEDLLPKILQFIPDSSVLTEPKPTKTETKLVTTASPYAKVNLDLLQPSAIVIGSSTGGPDALDKVFMNFVNPVKVPIFITQHMPPVFTASLARRISKITGTEAAEGKQWEEVVSNRIYIAPGDFHMSLAQDKGKVRIRLDQGPKIQSVRPAVDPLFQSAAEIYGSSLLGVVLTGMGEDGLQGAHAIKKAGGGILIQDAGSCVVFGMPGAIYKADIFDRMGDLSLVKSVLEKMAKEAGIKKAA